MGIDLTVTATYFRERRGEFLPTATLRFERDHGLFHQLVPEAMPCLILPLPAELKAGLYDDHGLTFRATDRQGQPLTFTTPANLRKLTLPGDISPWNRAVLAFLFALPADTRLILNWS
jgi:hypothetical protein